MKTALVTGATGFVGSHLCQELLQNGYKVRALHRASSDLNALQKLTANQPELEKYQGDISDRAALDSAMQGVDVVFHIAALFRQAKFADDVYWKVNVEGTRNVLESAKKCGVERVVHCSTVGVHSHIPNPPASEEEDFRPGDIYQETKCEGEKIAREWFSSGKIKGVIVRPAMIWGPGDKRTLKLFRGLAQRKFPMIGSGQALAHWVLVDDLVRGFRLTAENDNALGKTYIFAGERPVTLKYLFSTIAKSFSTKPMPIRVPAWPVQVVGSIVEAICIPFGLEPPIYRRRVDFFTKTRAFDISRAKKDLGYAPRYKFEDEVGYIASWYRKEGWV